MGGDVAFLAENGDNYVLSEYRMHTRSINNKMETVTNYESGIMNTVDL
jgi:hypothetical protein